MNISLLKPFTEIVQDLSFLAEYTSDGYRVQELNKFRSIILKLEGIPIIEDEMQLLLNSKIFKSSKDEMLIDFQENVALTSAINNIKGIMLGVSKLNDLYDSKELISKETSVRILLPKVSSFSDLGQVASEFKKSIEIQVINDNIGGSVDIIATEKGSIWLVVSLGTVSAVNLVAAIFWAAAVIKKKRAEVKIFEAHARTLDLKNEMLSSLIDAQQAQLNNILTNEATAIATGHFKASDPEVIERLKLSLTTAESLIEKGTKILPTSDNEVIMKSFPDYDKLSLIESQIRKLNA